MTCGALPHFVSILVLIWIEVFLASQDNYVGVGVNKNFNLGHNFQTKNDRAFVFHMCIPCDKTFNVVLQVLTLWPWPWSLTYFWKTLTLAVTKFGGDI